MAWKTSGLLQIILSKNVNELLGENLKKFLKDITKKTE